MKATIKSLSDEEMELVHKLDEKMIEVQKLIDSSLAEYTELMKPVEEVKNKIRKQRQELSPIAQMKASLVNAESRDKYFPDESKKSMFDRVKSYFS